jgi:hypothetical protein
MRTARVVACVPDDAMEWRPDEGRFGFADVIRHRAALERWMLAGETGVRG